MPTYRCPYCDEEIDHLNYSVSVSEYGEVQWQDDEDATEIDRSSLNYEHTDTGDWQDDMYTTCPNCDEELSTNNIIIEHQNEDEDEDDEPNENLTELERQRIRTAAVLRQNRNHNNGDSLFA